MRLNTQAYAKGYRAYLSGIFRTSNPFDVHNQHEAWEDWTRGWDCAEADDLN